MAGPKEAWKDAMKIKIESQKNAWQKQLMKNSNVDSAAESSNTIVPYVPVKLPPPTMEELLEKIKNFKKMKEVYKRKE